MKLIPRQKIWLTLIVLLNLGLWLIPSDVVEQIARDRQTMLGRYSRQHFAWIVGVALFSVVSFYVDWSTGITYRRRWFRVIASLAVGVPLLVIADFALRLPGRAHYIRDSLAYHLPPDSTFRLDFEDRPEAYRTYPNAPPGHETVPCVLHTDQRGFRNQGNQDQYDLVVIGDSFTEGSNVSDEHVWTRRLAQKTGLSVYNLGMSGYDPIHYVAALDEYALDLHPHHVLCLFYEGNDFRSTKSDMKRTTMRFSKRLKRYVKQSPLISACDQFLIRTFGPINSQGPVAGVEILNWLPLSIPAGDNARHYAFGPKQLRDLYVSEESFGRDRHWLNARSHLQEMNARCRAAGCTLIVAFAPTKAHVTLPLVAGGLEPKKVRDFTAITYKGPLPEPDEFFKNLLHRLDARENVVAAWCRSESVPFVRLTPALRKAAVEGQQVYYTYDQHWTPEGHRAVADHVYEFLRDELGISSERVSVGNP